MPPPFLRFARGETEVDRGGDEREGGAAWRVDLVAGDGGTARHLEGNGSVVGEGERDFLGTKRSSNTF